MVFTFNMQAKHCAFLALALLATAPSTTAFAQWRRDTASVASSTETIAAPDDARAVTTNPSALAYLPHYSVVYNGATTSNVWVGGQALYAAFPLPFGLAFGAGVEARQVPVLGGDFVGTLALAMRTSAYWSFGLNTRFMDSRSGALDGAVSVDLAASFRAANFLSLSAIARDVNAPGYNNPLLGNVPRSFALGVGLRPLRTRVSIDLAAAVDQEGHVGATAALQLPVPYVGTLFARGQLDRIGGADQSSMLTAGLMLNWGNISAGGGVLVGNRAQDPIGGFGIARLEGGARDGIPTADYVLDVELRGTSANSFIRLVAKLDRALHDPHAVGVLLRPRGSGLGLALAQELRLIIHELQRAGKHVVCHLDDATGSEYYACAGADSVLLDPAGGVRLMGPSSNVILLGEALANAGLHADFIRIGPFKSAPEQLANSQLSAPALEDHNEMIDDSFVRLLQDLSNDLGVPHERTRELVDEGPYVTSEALAVHIGDATADEWHMESELAAAFGGSYARLSDAPGSMDQTWGEAGRIGVVLIDGDIVDGNNIDIPFLDVHMTGGRTAARAIEQLAADPSVRAIVVRIDSPGGSALASDQVWRALRRARERKPVIASLGTVAASGGYYIASAANEIWADPSTITGSIGVFFGKVDVIGLANQLGISVTNIRRGRHAGADSIWRPFSDDERAMLADKVRLWYRLFLDRVSDGRNMTPADVDAAARGRVWSGDRALGLHLIDRLGGLQSALVRARALADLRDDAPITVVPRRPEGILDYVLGTGGSASASADGDAAVSILAALPSDVRAAIRTAIAMQHMGDMSALALMPYSIDLR